jgi:hypothetical protein
MIIGYSVLYIKNDITVKDILWERRVVYSTWERALEVANLIANKEKEMGDEYYIISIVTSKSKESCNKYGNTQLFTINMKCLGEVGNVCIIPVYDE